MSEFLKEDVNARQLAASNTPEFLKSEADRLSDLVDEVEDQIAAFKVENNRALPEHLSMHLDMLSRTTRDLSTTESSIAGFEEELRFLEAQLANSLTGAGGENGPAQELARLQSELTRLRATYTDANPSVQAVKDEIDAIKRQMAPSGAIKTLTLALETARTALLEAERAETPDAELISERRAAVTKASQALSDQFAKEASSNPGSLITGQLQARIATTKSRIDVLKSQQVEIRERIDDLQNRIAMTPEVERKLAALTRDYQNIYQNYQEVLNNQQSAVLAENLEENQKAEKFRILEAAVQPEQPSSPERAKLSVLAIFAALGVGGAAAMGAEVLFSTVRGRTHMTALMNEHPIAVIPYIRRENEKRMPIPFARKKKAAPAMAASAAVALGAAIGPEIDAPEADAPLPEGDPATRQTS